MTHQGVKLGQIWVRVENNFKVKILGFRIDDRVDCEVIYRAPDCNCAWHLVVGHRWPKHVSDLYTNYALEE